MNLLFNKTFANDVVLLGFSPNFNVSLALFPFFSIVYLVTIVGNVFMVCVIVISPHLHTPMYFFLCNLAFIDFVYSSRTVPKFLADLLSSSRTISVDGCRFQVYLGLLLGQAECFLLALMAYDRYVAICRPLNYLLIMRWSVCYRLTAIIWVSSLMFMGFPSIFIHVEVCYPNQINHFACEVLAALKLSCNTINELGFVVMFVTLTVFFFPFVFVLLSYIVIISSILKLHSAGRSKAFSTCSSHITVVSLLYGTSLVIFISPSSNYTSDQEKYASLVTSIFIPMLNPLIYSLKNKEVTKIFRTEKKFPALRSLS